MLEKIKKFLMGFKYAFCGIFTAIKSERNLKVHLFMMIAVIIAGIYFNISRLEWFICIILFAIVIAGELFNTAIETIVDMVSPEKNDLAKKAKDVSAGAVLILAIGSAIIGLMIFIPKVM